MRRIIVILPVMVTASGCAVAGPGGGTPGSGARGTPSKAAYRCAEHRSTASPRPTPTRTRIPWRTEKMEDGSVRLTVGDLDAAPKSPAAERVTDHRSPRNRHECERVRYVPVDGWWCTTTVKPIRVSGQIVVNASAPTARIRGAGFSTHCSDRPGRMRQMFQMERDSWSGWRSYGEPHRTQWTANQDQGMGAVTEPCPTGRVGTYDYQLSVRIESDKAPIGEVTAASAPIRTHCGTGIS